MKTLINILSAFVMVASIHSVSLAGGKKDIVDTAVSAGIFNTLVTAVQAADLVDTLKSPGPFTVYAPTDEAFAALPEGALDALLADKDALTSVLLYHVTPGVNRTGDLEKLTKINTVLGEDVMFTINKDGDLVLNNSKIIVRDIEATNGVIQVIDAVLLP
ncbi:MAG: fasciclin domain-containing protein [Bdellovibrionales bacterium]|nr:fasciclin domain-containing protein [Bdellovibrionales bacterium]